MEDQQIFVNLITVIPPEEPMNAPGPTPRRGQDEPGSIPLTAEEIGRESKARQNLYVGSSGVAL